MTETYLHGKLSIASLAAPTEDDVAKIAALSDEDYQRFRQEVRARRRSSPVTNDSVDDIWDRALKTAQSIGKNRNRAL